MENKWPPDRVNTVSIPLAFSRRATSRPACMVWLDTAPTLMKRAYRRGSGSFALGLSSEGHRAASGVQGDVDVGDRDATFHPSLHWGTALPESLRWIALAWLISAVCVLAILVLLRFTTRWGRQYWRITHGYFTGRTAVPVWLMLGVLLLSVVTA